MQAFLETLHQQNIGEANQKSIKATSDAFFDMEPTEAAMVCSGVHTEGMFDSTMKTGEPASFSLGGVIDGWKDVVQYMVVGDVFRMWIPERLAYTGKSGRPAGTLVFDIELLSFE